MIQVRYGIYVTDFASGTPAWVIERQLRRAWSVPDDAELCLVTYNRLEGYHLTSIKEDTWIPADGDTLEWKRHPPVVPLSPIEEETLRVGLMGLRRRLQRG